MVRVCIAKKIVVRFYIAEKIGVRRLQNAADRVAYPGGCELHVAASMVSRSSDSAYCISTMIENVISSHDCCGGLTTNERLYV